MEIIELGNIVPATRACDNLMLYTVGKLILTFHKTQYFTVFEEL